MKTAIEFAAACVMAPVVCLLHVFMSLHCTWQVKRLAAKYRLKYAQENELFFFLMGMGGCRKIIKTHPHVIQKEFPDVWEGYQKRMAQPA
ncbi:hypothetical protein [Nitrospira sp. BLG_2]|uniref:hypothetical protein n=1 Tax=Nitrospira sp. BLG_2 TaxID=3397507 RepID=UPI003B995F3D